MKPAPERYRDPQVKGDHYNGRFVIPHYKIADYFICCIASNGLGWEHVSVTIVGKKRRVERCPTWEEMCYVKDQFWGEEECVVQYHPPKSEYVSNHPYCLHLWKNTVEEIQRPLPQMVGLPEINIQKF